MDISPYWLARLRFEDEQAEREAELAAVVVQLHPEPVADDTPVAVPLAA